MKTFNKIACYLSLMLFSLIAYATEPLEMFVNMGEGVQIVITDQPCEKWTKTQTGMDLHYAYAVNNNTGEKVTGCYGHDDLTIYIELVDEVTKNIYTYHIKADNFVNKLNV